MKPTIRRLLAVATLSAAAVIGPAAAAHADGTLDAPLAPVTETADDTAWGAPPVELEPTPAPEVDVVVSIILDTAWG